MHGITKLAMVATVVGLVTAPCWKERRKTKMDLLADKITMCDGVAKTEQVGRSTKASINIVLDPNAPIEVVAQCVRLNVEEAGWILSSVCPTCFSRPIVELSTESQQKVSVVFGEKICFSSR